MKIKYQPDHNHNIVLNIAINLSKDNLTSDPIDEEEQQTPEEPYIDKDKMVSKTIFGTGHGRMVNGRYFRADRDGFYAAKRERIKKAMNAYYSNPMVKYAKALRGKL